MQFFNVAYVQHFSVSQVGDLETSYKSIFNLLQLAQSHQHKLNKRNHSELQILMHKFEMSTQAQCIITQQPQFVKRDTINLKPQKSLITIERSTTLYLHDKQFGQPLGFHLFVKSIPFLTNPIPIKAHYLHSTIDFHQTNFNLAFFRC